ncbi:hypothetical protein [Cyanobium gracile]|uniref:Uncharacterized protein n=1 Tax=Cyanobium gracile (strain ATCC 27147 / PCC 6307) TaxID=292564 RepID=K9PBG4_CYAGP|nr:hypothetical protein [Cyanobium gracile]AFY30293.1 hypothetical protein Cyagr_3214 [Cyanobium gracile PCC 6307]
MIGTRPLLNGLGGLALALEGVGHLALAFDPPLARLDTVPHGIAWLLFFLVALIRKVKTLVREPFVTLAVVMGATSGYLLDGIPGGGPVLPPSRSHRGAIRLRAAAPVAVITAAGGWPVRGAWFRCSQRSNFGEISHSLQAMC